jgi:O-antigen ligase
VQQPLTDESEKLPASFLPLDKMAFGLAVGTAFALAIFLLTAIHVIRNPRPGFDLGVLAGYFAGYSVSWTGAFIGAAWAGFSGFVVGFFAAFLRNFSLAVFLFIVRTRAELAQTRDFLDHI